MAKSFMVIDESDELLTMWFLPASTVGMNESFHFINIEDFLFSEPKIITVMIERVFLVT